MPKDFPSSLKTALQADHVALNFFVELHFDEGVLRLCTASFDTAKTINGSSQTFTGAGRLLTVSMDGERGDLSAIGATLTLSGVDATVLSRAVLSDYAGRKCSIFIGVDGSSTVHPIFTGLIDIMTVQDQPESSIITLTAENELIKLNRTSALRYTSENHKARATANANDTFFDFATSLADKKLYWGR